MTNTNTTFLFQNYLNFLVKLSYLYIFSLSFLSYSILQSAGTAKFTIWHIFVFCLLQLAFLVWTEWYVSERALAFFFYPLGKILVYALPLVSMHNSLSYSLMLILSGPTYYHCWLHGSLFDFYFHSLKLLFFFVFFNLTPYIVGSCDLVLDSYKEQFIFSLKIVKEFFNIFVSSLKNSFFLFPLYILCILFIGNSFVLLLLLFFYA